MKQQFDFDYCLGEASAQFTVDRAVFNPTMALQYLEFFRWEEHYDEDADPIDEYMKKLAVQAIRFATIHNHNTYGVTCDFADAEGWPPVNGSCGIKLINVVGYEFREAELEVTVQTLDP